MQLDFENFDGRARDFTKVIDVDTKKPVGHIQSHGVGTGNSGGITVSLFNAKYEATLHSRDEVRGFIRGVQTVLNHVVKCE